MAESKRTPKVEQQPERRERDVAHEREEHRHEYTAGADGEQDVDAGPAEVPEQADDHSEREWGGDQDIDTAGMVPGNKATDDKEPTGF